jgi:nitrate reductase / nitrite oxidoreductase, beta subunit
VNNSPDEEVLKTVSLNVKAALSMYELLSIAKYEDRFVIPTVSRSDEKQLYKDQGVSGYPDML